MLCLFFKNKTKLIYTHHKDIFPKFLLSIGVIIFFFVMITHPKIVFEGSSNGISVWWNIVFPSLLPFYIISELLMSLGIVNFMGILLEPIMRPVFNVPGAGSFVMAIGFTSGYPIGAMVTARLRSDNLCTRIEAERLISFTNNSSPLFMLVAVAVGMFNNPALGIIIAGAHYLGNITLGLLLRFYGRNDIKNPSPCTVGKNIPRKAFQELVSVLKKEQRPPGKILSDAVKNSLINLLNIGGFIILFAVIIKLFTDLGFITMLAQSFYKILHPLGVNLDILQATASGIFEMTMGTKLASQAPAPLLQQLVAVGIILAWSGLSILAQSASMISHTDIRFGPFLIARIFHAIFTGIYTVILYYLLQPSASVFKINAYTQLNWITTLNLVKTMIFIFFIALIFIITLSLLVYLVNYIFNFFIRYH
ncbi:MAG: sporulation integral membrane protein YlbJ [Clostridiales bacterium]|nr:sporulation integral membrane protein YlbJ [Clostridiales bacterium]MCF8022585.1 sporulation integral membrane protein YlbJ [Clostridiales bacterium]